MKLLKPILKSLPYKDGRLICTNWPEGEGYHGNVYRLNASDGIVWQVEPPEDQSNMGVSGDAYGQIWFEGQTFVAGSLQGFEYSIDLETGKRLALVRYVPWK